MKRRNFDMYDGREERLDAMLLEMRLKNKPKVVQNRKAYNRRVAEARAEAERIGKKAVIERLIEKTPAYIRDLLETEDERFGKGALASRYAYTFQGSPLFDQREDKTQA